MIQDSEISGYDLVLQYGASGDVDLASFVGNYDDRALQRDPLAEGHIAGDRQMVQFQNVGDAGETGQKILNLKK